MEKEIAFFKVEVFYFQKCLQRVLGTYEFQPKLLINNQKFHPLRKQI